MAADRANRKSEKYSNSRRGLSGRLKCKFVHKSLSASASCRGWIWALPVLCPQKCYTRATLLEGAGCLEWDSPHATWRRTSVYGCVCVTRESFIKFEWNENRSQPHTHTRTHTRLYMHRHVLVACKVSWVVVVVVARILIKHLGATLLRRNCRPAMYAKSQRQRGVNGSHTAYGIRRRRHEDTRIDCVACSTNFVDILA